MNRLSPVLVATVAFFTLVLFGVVYLLDQNFAPLDQQAADIRYVSPEGNNSNPGTNESPWKTLKHANDNASAGATIILKNGVYSGSGQAYVDLTKPGVIWKAENKHQAIIDGGFSPESIGGNWNGIVSGYNNRCNITNGRQAYVNLLTVKANGVVIDGLFLRNSCGRGVLLANDINDAALLNSRIDWTMIAGFYVSGKTKNLRVIGNEMTRISFNDEYGTRVVGYCQPASTPPSQQIKKYCVNISVHMSGEDMIVRDNIIAFGRGEIAMTGARNLLFENNTVIANKNNFYSGWADGLTVRNNFFWNPDAQLNPGTHWEKSNKNENDWHMSSRNENDDRWKGYASGLNNVSFYNNLIINNSFQLNGYHNGFSSNTTNVYIGHNTLVTGPHTDDFFKIGFNAVAGATGDSRITALLESNIFDVTKDANARFIINKSSNDVLTFRNNVLPANVAQSMRGENDIYTNNTGISNPGNKIEYMMPAIGAANVNMAGLKAAVGLENYVLRQNSPAVNKGSLAGSVGGISVPQLARQIDFLKTGRDGMPDIGAFELNGSVIEPTPSTETPDPSATPTPKPSITPSLTPTPPVTGAIVCGKADVNGDGYFGLPDFVAFAKVYGNGQNLCNDKNVDYGPCGGRDWNRDGKLSFVDFGGSVNGFSKRYSPNECDLRS